MLLIKKLAVMLVSAGLGLVAGTAAATPFIALANFAAEDGPIFPAPLVAFGFLALPICGLLLLLQAGLVVYELLARRDLGLTWWWVGIIGGAAAGLLWSLLLSGGSSQFVAHLLITALGAFQGMWAFGLHWLASRLRLADTRSIEAFPSKS